MSNFIRIAKPSCPALPGKNATPQKEKTEKTGQKKRVTLLRHDVTGFSANGVALSPAKFQSRTHGGVALAELRYAAATKLPPKTATMADSRRIVGAEAIPDAACRHGLSPKDRSVQ